MARTNKYTSINFNHILEKNLPTTTTTAANSKNQKNQSSSSSYSTITSLNNSYNCKTHFTAARNGRMLVLTPPTPKPISITPPTTPTQSKSATAETQLPKINIPERTQSGPLPDKISLRPLGRTGSGPDHFSPVLGKDKGKDGGDVIGSPSPKSDKFVPPHLRPGFVGRQDRPAPQSARARDSAPRHFGYPGRYGEDGRPKSGGYERTRRGVESDLGSFDRPRSSGNRPSTTGSWYCF